MKMKFVATLVVALLVVCVGNSALAKEDFLVSRSPQVPPLPTQWLQSDILPLPPADQVEEIRVLPIPRAKGGGDEKGEVKVITTGTKPKQVQPVQPPPQPKPAQIPPKFIDPVTGEGTGPFEGKGRGTADKGDKPQPLPPPPPAPPRCEHEETVLNETTTVTETTTTTDNSLEQRVRALEGRVDGHDVAIGKLQHDVKVLKRDVRILKKDVQQVLQRTEVTEEVLTVAPPQALPAPTPAPAPINLYLTLPPSNCGNANATATSYSASSGGGTAYQPEPVQSYPVQTSYSSDCDRPGVIARVFNGLFGGLCLPDINVRGYSYRGDCGYSGGYQRSWCPPQRYYPSNQCYVRRPPQYQHYSSRSRPPSSGGTRVHVNNVNNNRNNNINETRVVRSSGNNHR